MSCTQTTLSALAVAVVLNGGCERHDNALEMWPVGSPHALAPDYTFGIKIDGLPGFVKQTNSQSFPATLMSAPGRCSATLVGPDVALTAGHCAGSTILKLEFTPEAYYAKCEVLQSGVAPEYTTDLAICKLTKPLTERVQLETIADDLPRIGASILLTGVTDKGFATAEAKVLDPGPRTDMLLTGETAWTEEGDSGYPVFDNAGKGRKLLAVSSWGQGHKSRSQSVQVLRGIITHWQADRGRRGYAETRVCGFKDKYKECR